MAVSCGCPRTRVQAPRIKVLLIAMARERLGMAVAQHAAALGKPHGRITLRDPRSRWGSCTAQGKSDVLLAADHGAARDPRLRRRA